MKFIITFCFFFLSCIVKAQFIAEFNADKTVGCAPLIINFTDESSADANQWTWSSSDGVSSTLQNPTLVFTTPGNFEVTLTSSNGNESNSKTIAISVSPGLRVDFSANANNGCVPFSTELNDLSVPQSSAIKEWFWSVSNGFTSSEQNPTVNFQYKGKYNVLLKVTDDNGCEASFSKIDFITAGAPLADFSFDSISCQIPASVNFIQESKGENLSYLWDFGNGNTSNAERPPKQEYLNYDTLQIKLLVQEGETGCKDSVKKNIYITNYEAKMNIKASCNTDNFSFILKDETYPTPTSVLWDLGDGNENINSEFTHQYANNAPITITLTAKNGESCENTTTLNYKPPKANFGWEVENQCDNPYAVNFSNVSSGIGLYYAWDFRDSSAIDSSFEKIHNFKIPPVVLNPRLTVVDTFNCESSISKRIDVPIPVADFGTENEKISGCAPLTIDFIDLSERVRSPVKEIKWNYGDPNSGNLNNGIDSLSSHTYNTPGMYDVTMIIVLESGCSDTIIKEEYVLVGELPLSADFNIQFTDTICFGETLSFEGTSTYSNPTYFADYHCWAFEENTLALLKDSETPPEDCPEAPTNFLPTDKFVHSPIPDHQYSNFEYENSTFYSGNYYMGNVTPSDSALSTHLILGFHGCYQEVIKPVHALPTAAMIGFAFEDTAFSLTACDGARTVGIYNASQDYDSLMYFRVVYEPTQDTVLKIAEFDTAFYSFNQPGNYFIQIGVFDESSGCQNETERVFHVLEKNMKINLPPTSCRNIEVTAIDESSYSKGKLTERAWMLNGEFVSAAYFPDVRNDTLRAELIDTGWNVYTLLLSLETTDDLYGFQSSEIECRIAYSDSIYLEGTSIKIELDTNVTCTGDSVLFKNLSKGTSSTQNITWTLKDSSGILSSTDSLKVAYDQPNDYLHTIIISNSFGCSDTSDTPNLTVSRPILNFIANDTVVCKGDAVEFDSQNSRGNDLNFTWTIEGSQLINPKVVHTFLNIGSFDVKLHAIDQYTCEDSVTYSKYMRVSELPDPDFYTLDIEVDCPPFTIQFLDSSQTDASSWQWSSSDGGSGNFQNYLHTFTSAGTFDVQLTSTNEDGCTNTIVKPDYVTIRGPQAEVNLDKTTICSPEDVKFKMNLTDVAYFVWEYDDGIIESEAWKSNIDSVVHRYNKAGFLQPRFTVIDTTECIVVIPNVPIITSDKVDAVLDVPQNFSCNFDTVNFANKSSAYFPTVFNWDFGDGNTSSDTSGIHVYLASGIYSVRLTAESNIGCRDSSEVEYTVHQPPNETLEVSNPYFCVPATTVLELKYESPNFSPEEVFFSIDEQKIMGKRISNLFSQARAYSMGYQINYAQGQCQVDSQFTHTYYEFPEASFDYDPKKLSLEIPEISFTSYSLNSTIWSWNFGDGTTQNNENPRHNFKSAKKHLVTLITANAGGCQDTTSTEIAVAPNDIIRLPNAFTPDGDGYDDKFGVLFAGKMEILSFTVFNRWGNIVFKTADINEKWDGIYNGKPQNHGTYVYYVKGRNTAGKILEYRGNFSLIR